MPIRVVCSSCGKRLQVRDELVGKRLKCPSCGNTFLATADVQATAPSNGPKLKSDVAEKDAFSARPMATVRPPARDDDSRQDSEDRPARLRRKKRKKKAQSSNVLWMGIAAGAGVFVVVVVGVAVLVARGKDADPVAQNQGKQRAPGVKHVDPNNKGKKPAEQEVAKEQTVKEQVDQGVPQKPVAREKARPTESPGSVEQGPIQVLYSDGATRQEAERLVSHFAQDARNQGPLQLKKTANGYLIRVKPGEDANLPTTQKAWGITAARISRDVFAGAMVEGHLCDAFFNTIKVLPHPADFRYGVVDGRIETFFAAAGDRDDATRLARYLATIFANSAVPVVSTKFARRGDVAEVHLVTKKEALNDMVLMELHDLVRGISTNVFAGGAIELHLCDSDMDAFQVLRTQ